MMKIRQKKSKINTVIGKDTILKGDIAFTDSFYLDGQINGNVIASKDKQSTLSVGRHGKITGNVRVINLILDGTIVGDVFATGVVQLAEHAHVSGSVYYHLLEMESGAEVNGKMIHEKNSDQSKNQDQITINTQKNQIIKVK